MIKKKAIGYISILLFILTCTLFIIYTYLHYSIIPAYQTKLFTMATTRAHEINTFLNIQEKNAVQLSQETEIIDALYKSSSQKEKLTQEQQQTITTLLAAHKEIMGFKNIILAAADNAIIFSTTTKNITGINLNEPQYIKSSLGKSHERAAMTLTNDFSNFNFNDLLEEPALFITIPLLKDKKFIGTLSYQIDQDNIYLITHQYIGLEKTGEVVLAKKEGNNAIFLGPTRSDPDIAFKTRALFTHPPIAIQASILGQEGFGIAIDYHGKKVVGAWKFIPKLDWGMIIKIDLDEILKPAYIFYIIFLICLVIFMLSILCNVYLFYPIIQNTLHTLNKQTPCNKIPSLCKKPIFIALLIATGFATKNIIQVEQDRLSAIEQAQNKAIEMSTDNAETIENIFAKIAFVAQSIAEDLHNNYLKKDDIATRINRDLKENSILTEISVIFVPYAYDPSIELYAQTTGETRETISSYKTKWYTQALEKSSVWLIDPMHHENNHIINPTAAYARTFFDKDNKLTGVIAVTFSLTPIMHIAEYSGIGQTGYSIITADNGRFIFHPLTKLIYTEETLLQYAQSKGNEELASIAQKIITGKPLMASYASETTKEPLWIYTHPITINNWVMGTIFSQDEISIPADIIRHYYFWILIWMTIALSLFFALLWYYNIFSLTYYTIIANIILVLSLITTWYIIKKTTSINRESKIIITDQSTLNKFLNDLNDEAERKHETPPINIPCGILLYSLTHSGPDNITLSGYIWNKYNTKLHTTMSRAMELPQATRMVWSKPLTVEENEEETVTWNIQGVMFQEQNYALYPFDQQQLQIILEHKDFEKNIILTPDLIAYKKISPESTPGLDPEFSVAGFTIEQTFFEYQKIQPTTNFGLTHYDQATNNYQLIYNAIMNRNLLNPCVIYLLPLLVILFSLFSTLLVEGKRSSPLSILGGYTGLFFALIVLQRSLREQYPSGSTLYMEYAFFYTYITIILLIMHIILMYYYKRWQWYQNKSLYFMKILFWPFQWLTWLITTLTIFY